MLDIAQVPTTAMSQLMHHAIVRDAGVSGSSEQWVMGLRAPEPGLPREPTLPGAFSPGSLES